LLAFVVPRQGIHVAPVYGEWPVRRLSTGAEDGAPAFSSDGRKVYFETRVGGEAEIRAVEVEGGEPTTLLGGGARKPSVSSDGSWIAYLQETSTKEAMPMIFTQATGARAPLSKELPAGLYAAMRFVPGASRVAIERGDSEILEIDLATGAVVERYDVGGDQIGGFSYLNRDLVVSQFTWEGDLWTATLAAR
jgi:hypothetical protein